MSTLCGEVQGLAPSAYKVRALTSGRTASKSGIRREAGAVDDLVACARACSVPLACRTIPEQVFGPKVLGCGASQGSGRSESDPQPPEAPRALMI